MDFERRTRVRLVIWEEGHAPCLHGLPAVELKVNTTEQMQGTQYNGTCMFKHLLVVTSQSVTFWDQGAKSFSKDTNITLVGYKMAHI